MTLSFTSTIKNEVTKLEITPLEKIAELSAIFSSALRLGNNIEITTENASVARRIFSLVKDLYQINPSVTMRKSSYQKKALFIINIKQNVSNILKDVGLDQNIPAHYIIDDEESKRSFLRGIFLMTGSINDPKKSRYHLEFSIEELDYAIFLSDLLNEFNLNSKYLKRENKYMVYIKEAEKIGDFLRIISAYNAVLYYEDIRIYRDHKNMTNRLNNCEQANMDRVVETANKQVKDIEYIMNTVGLDLLDEKEQIVAQYRMKYKDVSLLELSEIIGVETGNNITKSGLYHRFKKIENLAQKIHEKQGKKN